LQGRKNDLLQKLLAILLLFALTLQGTSQLTVLAGYELHKSYIAQVLCVNRDKPAMHCNGKCYLMKKLRQDQQRKDSQSGNVAGRLDIVLYCPEPSLLLYPHLRSARFVFSPVITAGYLSPCFGFFHPPRSLPAA
jgi:hypothetical protein